MHLPPPEGIVFILAKSSPALLPAMLVAVATLFAPAIARAGGPKFISGSSFFNPGVQGQPVHWSGGQLNYYVDRGPLNAQVTNQ